MTHRIFRVKSCWGDSIKQNEGRGSWVRAGLALAVCACAFAGWALPLNDGWTADGEPVTLPHCWNVQDGTDGPSDLTHWNHDSVSGTGYTRRKVVYRRMLPPSDKTRYLRVNAASIHAVVRVDGVETGRHVGAFTAFSVELPQGAKSVEIEVDNFYDPDVPPVCGDFTMYGGLYRGVDLLDAPETFPAPTDLPKYEFREDGFYVDGVKTFLRGVCYHQDREGRGWAIQPEEEEADIRLIKAMGANAIRTSHYPRSEHFYEMCDKYGLYVWTEIPLVDATTASAAFRSNTLNVAREMVLQHRHHKCIAMWGIFNELYLKKMPAGQAEPLVREVKALIRSLDPRPIVAASDKPEQTELNAIPDAIGFNMYPGWYGGKSEDLGGEIEKWRTANGRSCVAISEYGAGGSLGQIADEGYRPSPEGKLHPVAYQLRHHQKSWAAIKANPHVWGSFLWVMFDVGSDSRHEGARDGINDKGLVGFDHRSIKPAYWFYQKEWTRDGAASIDLAPIFADHMVFAADKPVRVFGTGAGHAVVEFCGARAETVSKGDNWCLELPAVPAGGPYELKVWLDGREMVFNDVMVGEVLMIAGQSNMQFKLSDSASPADSWQANPAIRFFSTQRLEVGEPYSPQDGWIPLTQQNAGRWSALGYETAIRLAAHKGCAVGVVNCYQGASTIQAWMSATLSSENRFALPPGGRHHQDAGLPAYSAWNRPGTLYVRQFGSVVPYSLSHVIWYQGESNTGHLEGLTYAPLLAALIDEWRGDLRDPKLPFVVVQLADFTRRADADWQSVQTAQAHVADLCDGVRVVKSSDVCENDDIHPKTKARLAERIAAAVTEEAQRKTTTASPRIVCENGICRMVEDGVSETPPEPSEGRLLEGYRTPEAFVAFLRDEEPFDAMAAGTTGFWLTLALILLGGLAMNLTPCVLPMIPVTILVLGRKPSRGLAFGAGMAMAYGVLGLAVVRGMLVFGTIQSSPLFNGFVALVFFVLGLSLCGVFSIDLTRFRPRLAVRAGWLSPFALGVLSAILAGSCVAPIVISVLVLTTRLYADGHVLALALPFVLGLGMALPWPFVGAGLKVLPEPGAWMRHVNRIFALFVFGLAVWYGRLACRGLNTSEAVSGDDAMNVLVATPSTYRDVLSQAKRPVLVDCWASWCKNCAAMEAETMQNDQVRAALSGVTVIRLQAEDIEALRALPGFAAIHGLPAFLYLK